MRPALLTTGLLLMAGAAAAAPAASGDLAALQGNWALPGRADQVLSISGGTARLTSVDGAAGKAGYAKGDILVQGLAYESETRFKDGRRTLTYAGVCRARGAKGAWSVADCKLQVALPGDAGPTVLSATPAFKLIAGEKTNRALAEATDRKAKPPLAGGPAPAVQAAIQTAAKPPEAAKVPEAPKAPEDPNNTWARRSISPEELAAQDAGTQRLNADINARNAAIEARNKKADADYRAAQAARDAQIAASKAAHDKSMADYRAQVAAQEAANAKAQADWQAAVKACNAGDKSKCAQPAPK